MFALSWLSTFAQAEKHAKKPKLMEVISSLMVIAVACTIQWSHRNNNQHGAGVRKVLNE